MLRFGLIFLIVTLTGPALPAQPYALDFVSYIGGAGYEQVRDLTTDDSGNIYITGGTASADFPTTAGSFQTRLMSGGQKIMDAFVMKLLPDGKVVWSTLLGGPEYDRAYAIEVDRSGNVYIAGRAGRGLPVTGQAFQKAFAGDSDPNPLYGEQDGFIAKLPPDGSGLIWCSYFGAAGRGFIRDFALDSSNNICLIATEASADYPWVAAQALQPRRKSKFEGVVAKVASDGSRVIWATYLGGSGNDLIGPSIKVNSRQELIVCGTTDSEDLPVTAGTFDSSFNGMEDLYIAVINQDGTRLLSGSYLGGTGHDGTETHNLALDGQDHIIVAATTSSPDFPVTPGAFQTKYGGSGARGSGLHTNYPFDGFVAKLSPDGSRLIAATYLGGSAGEGLEGVGTDAQGNVFCAGSSFSRDLKPKSGGLERNLRPAADQLVASFSPDLSALRFLSFPGGDDTDFGRTLCMDPFGNILLGGETRSGNLPASNPYQGGQDGTLVRIRVYPVPTLQNEPGSEENETNK